MLKFVLIMVVACRVFLYSAISNEVADLSKFDKVPVVALWRGVHFLPNHFTDTASIDRFSKVRVNGVPLYCSSAYQSAGVAYNSKLRKQDCVAMDRSVGGLRRIFSVLNNRGAEIIDGQEFYSARDAFQQKYTNSTDFISRIGNGSQSKYRGILNGLPKGNPLLSFSKHVKHPALYAYGMKDYGSSDCLTPEYDDLGKPANSVLGHLQCCLLTDEEAKAALPYDVQLNHQAGYIKVKTYSSCNILSEAEVSVVGKMSGGSVVFSTPLEVPDFSAQYDHTMKSRFGLTKRRFENAKAIIADAQTSEEEKDKKVSDVIKGIIEGKQTGDLAHESTMVYSLPKLLEDAFDGQGIEFRKGAVDINGRVREVGE